LKQPEIIDKKILSLKDLRSRVLQWKFFGKKIAFTNGCFDILHAGHIYSLSQAAKEADYLVVAVNSDSSVKKLKGKSRPINNETNRAGILASLTIVDAVIIFEEDTPLELIQSILPDVLVKGGDYKPEEIAGAREVIANGGRVVINPVLKGFSTSSIISKIKEK
jgi:D-beta-D-heptose 7-phosphate kinase/D-beta-D-heptose 1-phosphate adenosyltransferase